MSKALPACPVEVTLMLISDRWKVLILRDLLTGTKRFGELKKSLTGISQKVLTANLRDMEANGLLTRRTYPEVPPRVEYTLTEIGESLRPVLGAMFDWGMDYKRKNNSPSNALVEALGKARTERFSQHHAFVQKHAAHICQLRRMCAAYSFSLSDRCAIIVRI